jgi:hypothetical protein
VSIFGSSIREIYVSVPPQMDYGFTVVLFSYCGQVCVSLSSNPAVHKYRDTPERFLNVLRKELESELAN